MQCYRLREIMIMKLVAYALHWALVKRVQQPHRHRNRVRRHRVGGIPWDVNDGGGLDGVGSLPETHVGDALEKDVGFRLGVRVDLSSVSRMNDRDADDALETIRDRGPSDASFSCVRREPSLPSLSLRCFQRTLLCTIVAELISTVSSLLLGVATLAVAALLLLLLLRLVMARILEEEVGRVIQQRVQFNAVLLLEKVQDSHAAEHVPMDGDAGWSGSTVSVEYY
mmetsp:Transcript_14850/g.28256  ORF Transcript_14850/g.28256 Transcript_14850/m.28256 type:complete len:225 (-) Transcript_14850:263-937(-)